ncbi:MAG: S6e family ribosomal protein [archaeon]
MAFKINIADNKEKGKTYKIESNSETLIGLKLGDAVKGSDVDSKLEGYDFIIQGASDKAGFPSFNDVEGTGLKRVLLTYGRGMKETKPKGLKRRKTVRGNTISTDIVQINLKVKKQGSQNLAEIFPEQIKVKEEPKAEVKEEAAN